MDVTTLTAVMSRLVTVTEKVTYSSTSSATTEVPFANLISAGAIDINQSGDISLPKLATVVGYTGNTGTLVIEGDDAPTGEDVTATVSLPLLTKVSGSMTFTNIEKATTFSMPVMVEHDDDITITIDKTGTIDLSSFKNDTLQSDGSVSTGDLLTVTAGTLTAPVYTVGKIIGSEITAVSLPLWQGTNDSQFPDATSVVLPKITAKATGTASANAAENSYSLVTLAAKATSIHIVGNTAASTGATPVTNEISVSGSQNKVQTLILDGVFATVNLTDNTNLTTLTFDATAEAFTLHGSDVVTLEMDLTSAAAVTGGLTSVKIEDNSELESLTVNSSDNLNELAITGNSELASVSFPDLDSATANALLNISGNALVATTTATTVGTTTTYATTGDIKAFADYFDSAIANRKGTVEMKVVVENVTQVNSDGVAADPASYTFISLKDEVLTSAATDAIAQTKAWNIPQDGLKDLQINIGDDAVYRDSSNDPDPIRLSSSMTLAITELKSGASRASDLGLVLDAVAGGNVEDLDVTFYTALNSATDELASEFTSTTALDANDVIRLDINSQFVTTTVTAGSASTTAGMADAFAAAWTAKYNTASTLYTIVSAASKITISVASNTGNRANGHLVKVSATNDAGVVTSGTAPIISYMIGANNTDDNKLTGTDVILTLTNKEAGVTGVTFPSVTFSGTLTDTSRFKQYYSSEDGTEALDHDANNVYPGEARDIVVPAEEDAPKVVASGGAAKKVNETSRL